MQRETQQPRKNWQADMESYGFDIHHFDGIAYWAEDTRYRFSMKQIDELEDASNTLHQLCLAAVDHVISTHLKGDDRLISQFGIPQQFWPDVVESWQRGDKHTYSRFDLQYDGVNPPKMLEYNADTPTSLFEAAIVQWKWKEEVKPEADQFNSLHEALVERWAEVVPPNAKGERPLVHFAGCSEVREDFICYEYMRDTATQAGIPTKSLDISDIGWDASQRKFVDKEGEVIQRAFKLYPWEHMVADPDAAHLKEHKVQWFEPMWEMLLSNKAILPVLWEMNPGHPNLLKASFNAEAFAGQDHVVKPKLSREGANIKIVLNGMAAQHNTGIYDESNVVYQAYAAQPVFDGYRPIIGTWVVGDKACGMGIREDKSLISGNDSRFAPHYIQG